jgi:hypothetical protein
MGVLVVVSKIYKRDYLMIKSYEFESESEIILSKVSNYLYYRIPLSVIGYNPTTKDYKYIGEINDNAYPVLEWIGEFFDAKKEANLSGFIDLYASKKPIIKAIDFNADFINEILKNKYQTDKNLTSFCAIVFAGSFDRGEEWILNDYNNSFGWHGGGKRAIFEIEDYSCGGGDCNLSLKNPGERIYEKFYLVDSAYAIARAGDLNKSLLVNCPGLFRVDDNTLLLFYNYRPWKGESFCADFNGDGNVSILGRNVKAFRVRSVGGHLEIKITLFSSKGDINLTISKQKVVF